MNILRFTFKKAQYTLVLNFGFEKKLVKIQFSLRKMQLKCSSIASLIDNFAAHFISCINLKHVYKNWCASPKNR